MRKYEGSSPTIQEGNMTGNWEQIKEEWTGLKNDQETWLEVIWLGDKRGMSLYWSWWTKLLPRSENQIVDWRTVRRTFRISAI